jgi:hypothetical protein
MGTQSKRRVVKMESEKFAEILKDIETRIYTAVSAQLQFYAKEVSQPLAVCTAKLEVLEKLAMEKWGETPESLEERFFDRLDELNGIPRSTEPAKATDRIRIQFTQAHTEAELASQHKQTTMLILGKNQVNEALDNALIGLSAGDSFSVVLPPPEGQTEQVYVQGVVKAVYSIQDNKESVSAEVKAQAGA